MAPPWVPADQALRVIAFSPFAADYLRGLNPTHPAYGAMKKALADLRAIEAEPKDDKIPDGDIVKKGGSDARIPAVRTRLAELGFIAEPAEAADPNLLDAELSVQLRLFQKQAGVRVKLGVVAVSRRLLVQMVRCVSACPHARHASGAGSAEATRA